MEARAAKIEAKKNKSLPTIHVQQDTIDEEAVYASNSPSIQSPASARKNNFKNAILNEPSIENDYETITAKNNDSLFERKHSQQKSNISFAQPLTGHNTTSSFPKHLSTK